MITILIPVCPWCSTELCFQCDNPTDSSCCCKGSHGRFPVSDPEILKTSPENSSTETSDTGTLSEETVFITEEEKRLVGRPRQETLSAKSGRRRAGLIAKIPDGYICEWARLAYAGGGIVPIIGCNGNLAAALHHGPDKSTTNNEVGINLHRVCHNCHNRWHELNDLHYGKRPDDNKAFLPAGDCLPHNRLDQVGLEEIAKSEVWWKTPKLERKVDYREWDQQNQDHSASSSTV